MATPSPRNVYGGAECTVCAADCTNGQGDSCRGDGVTDAEEQCDDGNAITEECAEDECTVCAADCTEQPGDTHVCGDGVTDADEQCDDGNDDNTDDCTNACG